MDHDKSENNFQEQVSQKEQRKLKARREGQQSIWQGFGVFGLVGWSVAIPTVLFALLGIFLDGRYGGKQSYTLAMLAAGLFIGILNAWYWVDKKMKEINEEELSDE
ncbi:MAG: AtpZ/AtpI family protein [Phaeodactylibacter sp.]|nr:AtpZ/AtpI family protein [Phaeodactylibacter sp.]